MRIAAVEILDICQGKCKSTATLILIHEHGMRHPAGIRHGHQSPRHIGISYDIRKSHHIALLAVKYASSTSISFSFDSGRTFRASTACATYLSS